LPSQMANTAEGGCEFFGVLLLRERKFGKQSACLAMTISGSDVTSRRNPFSR